MKKELHDKIISILDKSKSVNYAEALKGYPQFHRYSYFNYMMMYLQRLGKPLSQVAGYRQWQRIGRYINKGEHGIMILAPIFEPKGKPETTQGTIAVPKATLDDDDIYREIMYYIGVYVFDISQTNGKPLITPPYRNPNAFIIDYELMKDRIIDAYKCQVIETPDEYARGGTAEIDRETKARTIYINNNRPQPSQAQSLIHETAHLELHLIPAVEQNKKLPDDETQEIEAELTLYAISSLLGYEVPGELYLSNFTATDTHAILTRIDKAIKKISRIINPDLTPSPALLRAEQEQRERQKQEYNEKRQAKTKKVKELARSKTDENPF
jgi:hypothetical protein